MVKVTDKDYYMDPYVVSNLEFCIKRTKKKYDNLLIIDGEEGIGKSTFGKSIGYYLSWAMNREGLKNTFTHENIFFDIEKIQIFARQNRNCVIIWDEAALGGMAVDWQDDYQQKLIKLMITCRKYQHQWIFIIPEFSLLKKYLACNRSIALFRVYSPDRLERGYFKAFAKKFKSDLYWQEKKSGQEANTWWNFYGRFTDTTGLFIDEEKYEAAKDAAIQSIGEEKKKPSRFEEMWKKRFLALARHLKDKKLFLNKEIAHIGGINQDDLSNLLTNYELNNKAKAREV